MVLAADSHQTLALVVASLVGFAAIATLVFNVWNAGEERKHARQMAIDERRFNLRRDFYAEVIEYLHLLESWMAATEPMFRSAGYKPPDLEADETAGRRLSARLAVYASPAVRDAAVAFMDGFHGFEDQVAALTSIRRQRHANLDGSDDAQHDDILEQRRLLDQIKQMTMARMRTVEQLAAAEISGS